MNRQILIIVVACLTFSLWAASCGKPKQEKINREAGALAGDFYLFSPDEEHVLRVVQPIRFFEDLSLTEILNRLGKHLETGYFSETSDGEKTHIMFNAEAVHRVNTSGASFRIGVVNMIDQKEIARTRFFQGSYGGWTTFCLIAATFLQPQNSVPLLDGLIVLYNGKPFPEMVHIDLTEIVTPKDIRVLVLQIVNRGKKSTVKNEQ